MSFELPIRLMREGLGNIVYSEPSGGGGGGGGAIAGANNGASISTLDPTKIVWGNDTGLGFAGPAALLSSREIFFGGAGPLAHYMNYQSAQFKIQQPTGTTGGFSLNSIAYERFQQIPLAGVGGGSFYRECVEQPNVFIKNGSSGNMPHQRIFVSTSNGDGTFNFVYKRGFNIDRQVNVVQPGWHHAIEYGFLQNFYESHIEYNDPIRGVNRILSYTISTLGASLTGFSQIGTFEWRSPYQNNFHMAISANSGDGFTFRLRDPVSLDNDFSISADHATPGVLAFSANANGLDAQWVGFNFFHWKVGGFQYDVVAGQISGAHWAGNFTVDRTGASTSVSIDNAAITMDQATGELWLRTFEVSGRIVFRINDVEQASIEANGNIKGLNSIVAPGSAGKTFVWTANTTAPATTPGAVIVNFFGSSATNFLGTPNRWALASVGGVATKIPCYD
jgi:hypothetical protein